MTIKEICKHQQPKRAAVPVRLEISERLAPRLGRVWRWLTDPPAAVRNPQHRHQAQLLSSLLVILLFPGTIALILQGLTFDDFSFVFPTSLGVYAGCVVAYGLSRTRHYRLGAIITTGMPTAVAFSVQIALPQNQFVFAFGAISVLLGSMLLSNRSLVFLVFVNILAMLLLPTLIPMWSLSAAAARFSFVIIVSTVLMALIAYRGFLTKRHQVELTESAKRYRNLFERVPIGLYRSTPDGRITDANPALVRMMGYQDRESLLAVNIRNLFVDVGDSDREQALLRRDGVVRGFETRLRRRDGTVLWVRDSTRAMHDACGQLLHCEGSLEDITERKLAEQAETEQRKLAETLREITLTLISQTDPGTVLAEIVHQAHRLAPHSATNLALLEGDVLRVAYRHGYPDSVEEKLCTPERRWDALPLDRQAILSRKPVVVPDTRDTPEWQTLNQTAWRSYIAVPIILRDQVLGLLRLNSATPNRFCAQDAQRLEPLAIAAAIALGNVRLYESLRERASQLELVGRTARQTTAIRELDELLQQTVTSTSETFGYYSVNVALVDGDHVELKATSLRSLDSAVGRVRSRVGGHGIMAWVAKSGEMLLVPDVSKEPRYLSSEDASDTKSELAVPIKLNGRIIGVLDVQSTAVGALSKRDIYTLEPIADQLAIAIENVRLFAEEERRTAELSRALEQQRELDRLRTEFVQNVSHELRTPLALIRGYAELLETGAFGELAPEQGSPLGIIAHRSRLLSKMMEDFTTILTAETQTLRREPVDMCGLIEKLSSEFRTTADEFGLDLTVELAQNLPMVLGEPACLQRVVENLMGNAFKFTPTGGSVELRLWQERSCLILEVVDTGIGIPADHLERVFERFYQIDGSTTRRYGGTGLGLALVKEIVEAHQGQATVQSTVGKGSAFRVTLPTV